MNLELGLGKMEFGSAKIRKEELLGKRFIPNNSVQLNSVVLGLQKSYYYPMNGTWTETWSRDHRTSQGMAPSSISLKMKTLQLILGHVFDLQITLLNFLFTLQFIY